MPAEVVVTRLAAPLLLSLRYHSPLPVVAPDSGAHSPGTPLGQCTVRTGCNKTHGVRKSCFYI